MNFSQEWDEVYKQNTHLCLWPWTDLVSYVMRYTRPAGNDFTVLELGCGAGPNIPFFKHLGVKYYAVEGSKTIVERLRQKFPEYKDCIAVGDFTAGLPFGVKFDLVVDRSSVTSNSTEAIKSCLRIVRDSMKPGAKYIMIDWFAKEHPDSASGQRAEDDYTRKNISKGHLANLGRIHFSDKRHLLELFKDFEIELMEHKIVRREVPEQGIIMAVWNMIVKKPQDRQ